MEAVSTELEQGPKGTLELFYIWLKTSIGNYSLIMIFEIRLLTLDFLINWNLMFRAILNYIFITQQGEFVYYLVIKVFLNC